MTCTPGGELAARRPINVDLPGHGREGCEIVLPVDRHPRQSITAVDMTSRALAERTTAIVQGDLGDCAEKRKRPGRGDNQPTGKVDPSLVPALSAIGEGQGPLNQHR